jgi:hypothetical protein
MATVQMIKGDILADIFDSPETIAQARREGYSLVNPSDITKLTSDLNKLNKKELVDLAREKGVYEKGLELKNKPEIIEIIQAKKPDALSRDDLIKAAIAKGFLEDHLNGISDDELAALLKSEE